MKTYLKMATVIALPIGLIASTATMASAKGAGKIDVSKASIDCTTVTGSAGLAPKITTTVPTKVNSKVKLSLSGCTVSGATGITTITGSAAGVLHATPGTFTGLPATAPVTGKLTIKWTSSAKLSGPKSVLHVTSVTVAAAIDGNASISIGGASVSGDFAGSDSGATSTLTGESTQTLAALAAAASTTGLGSVGLAGVIHLG